MSTADYNTLSFPSLNWEFIIKSTAFEIFGISVKWYGILICLGFFLAIVYCFKRMEKFGVDEDRAFDVVLWGAIGAIIGARLYYVFTSWDDFKGDLLSIFNTRNGGLAIYGGVIGALLFGFIAAKIRKLHFPPLLDLAGIGFLIGQSVGRWGNFFNHECFGKNTTLPWGMTSPRIAAQITNEMADVYLKTGIELNPNLPVHPCFLYESLWCALGILVLHFFSKRRKFDGEVFLLYIGWYGLGRMFIEGLRTDSLMIGNFRISQVVAVLCVITSITLIIIFRRKAEVDGYTFYKDTDDFKAKLAESKAKEKAYNDKAEAKKSNKLTKKDGELKNNDKIIDDDDVIDNTDAEEITNENSNNDNTI